MKRLNWGYTGTKASLALIATLLFVACGESPKNSETISSISPTFSSIFTNLIDKNCVECHQPGGLQQGANLDFRTSQSAYDALTQGTVSGSASGACSNQGIAYVQPGAPAQSYFVGLTVRAYQTNNFAGRTNCAPIPNHPGFTPDGYEDAIVQWVQNGAQEN